MARHAALALLIPVTGPRYFKPILQRWASNKSPFVMSGSKEVFERRTFHVEMDVWDADDKAAEILVKVLLASGRGEHVKVKVDKFSRGEFILHSTAPTTAPLTHATKRMTALVQEIADRFVREEKERMDNMSSLDHQLAASEKADRTLDEDERIAKEAAAIQSDMPTDVVVPTDAPISITDAITTTSSFTPSPAADGALSTVRSSANDPLPEYAGQKVWERHNRDVATSPRAAAQTKLAAVPPSNTIQIFPSSPYLASAANANSESVSLTSEQVHELIRPHIPSRSTFQVSTSPLHRTPSQPRSPPSLEIPPPPKVKKHYVSPEKNALDQTRKATIQSMPLPGEGAYYVVEFGSVVEADRVRQMLDDRVLADGTTLDVWFHEPVSEQAEGPGGPLHGLEWTEVRGIGKIGEGWTEVDLEEARELATKSISERAEIERSKREHDERVQARIKQMKEQEAAEEKRVLDEEKAKGAAASALETVAEEAEDVQQEAADVSETVAETVKDKAEDVKEAVLDSTSSAKEAVQNKIEDAPSASDVKHSTIAAAQETKESVVDKAEEIKDSVTETAAEARESVVETAHEVKEAVQEKAADAPSVSEVRDSVTEAAAQAKESVVEKAQEVQGTVADKVAEAPSAAEIKEPAIETAENVQRSVATKAEEIKETVQEKVAEAPSAAEVKDAAVSAAETTKAKAADAAASVRETVEAKVEEVKPQAASFVESIKEKAQEVKEAVVDRVEDVKERVEETVDEAEKKVEAEVEEVEEKVHEAEKNVEKEVKELEAKAEEQDNKVSSLPLPAPPA